MRGIPGFSFEGKPEASHDGHRGGVLGLGDADNRLEPEFLVPIANPGSPGFGGEAVTSLSLAEPPSDLDRREDLWEECRDGQTRPACEFAGVGDYDRRYGNARVLVVVERAFQERLGLASRPASTERVSPERLLSVEHREITQIVHRQRAKHESIGCQRRHPMPAVYERARATYRRLGNRRRTGISIGHDHTT